MAKTMKLTADKKMTQKNLMAGMKRSSKNWKTGSTMNSTSAKNSNCRSRTGSCHPHLHGQKSRPA